MKEQAVHEMFNKFMAEYDAESKSTIWSEQSKTFKKFWTNKIISCKPENLTDDDIDVVVKILDRNGKGNTKKSQAVARAMIPQGAWRRMFHELCSDNELSSVISSILQESDLQRKAEHIDNLYEINTVEKITLLVKAEML